MYINMKSYRCRMWIRAGAATAPAHGWLAARLVLTAGAGNISSSGTSQRCAALVMSCGDETRRRVLDTKRESPSKANTEA